MPNETPTHDARADRCRRPGGGRRDLGAEQGADLAIESSDSPDPVQVGESITYIDKATNLGPSSASGVTVTDTLPAGVTLVSTKPSQGSCSGTGPVTCTIGTMPAGSSATIVLVTKAAAAGKIVNTAEIGPAQGDPATANNTASEPTTVNAAPAPPPPPPPPPPAPPAPPPPAPPAPSGNGCTITGTRGNDVLSGTAGDDVICAGAGNDTVRGRGGDDVIRGGAGKDLLFAGRGDDIVSGGPARDIVYGGPGSDSLSGNVGSDALYGQTGADELYGGRATDLLNGGAGRDRCRGGAGADRMINCER
jgi:uncharacterized repeat protein (TIGR01451 family)